MSKFSLLLLSLPSIRQLSFAARSEYPGLTCADDTSNSVKAVKNLIPRTAIREDIVGAIIHSRDDADFAPTTMKTDQAVA